MSGRKILSRAARRDGSRIAVLLRYHVSMEHQAPKFSVGDRVRYRMSPSDNKWYTHNSTRAPVTAGTLVDAVIKGDLDGDFSLAIVNVDGSDFPWKYGAKPGDRPGQFAGMDASDLGEAPLEMEGNAVPRALTFTLIREARKAAYLASGHRKPDEIRLSSELSMHYRRMYGDAHPDRVQAMEFDGIPVCEDDTLSDGTMQVRIEGLTVVVMRNLTA